MVGFDNLAYVFALVMEHPMGYTHVGIDLAFFKWLVT